MRFQTALSRLQGRLPVMIVQRIKQAQMQHPPHRPCIEHQLVGPPARRIGIADRPAILARDHRHAVGPQAVKPLDLPLDDCRIEIGVACELEIGKNALKQRRAVLARIGPPQKRQQWMVGQNLVAIPHLQRHPRRIFRHHAHAAIDNRIFREPLIGQRCKPLLAAPANPQRRQLKQRLRRHRFLFITRTRSPAHKAPQPIGHRLILFSENSGDRRSISIMAELYPASVTRG